MCIRDSSGSYPVAISYSPSGTVVYGACSDPYSGDIKTFSRSDGSPIADNTVTTNAGAPVIEDGVAATPNGNAVYVRQAVSYTHLDVYKRQSESRPKAQRVRAFMTLLPENRGFRATR